MEFIFQINNWFGIIKEKLDTGKQQMLHFLYYDRKVRVLPDNIQAMG